MAVYLIIGLIAGAICAAMAPDKGRSALGWFFIGFLLPLIGIILIVVLPSVKREAALDASQYPGSTHGSAGPLDAVERLADLRAKGAITEQEYEQKKAELLARL